MAYGLEIAFAQVSDDSGWSGGFLHLTGYGTLQTPRSVLDQIEEWARLGHAGQLPWEHAGPVDVVGIVFGDSHYGEPLITYTPRFLPGGFFDGFLGYDAPPAREAVEDFLERHGAQPRLNAPTDLWIDVDGLINKVHDYSGNALANLRARAFGEA